MKLAGRRALVTGASRGIGRAIALGLAREAADVVLVARSEPDLSEAAVAVRDLGRQAWTLPADLADPSAVERLVERVLREVGPVDVLVNNAGVQPPIGPLGDCAPDAWLSTLQVNLGAPMQLMHAFAPRMVEQGWGTVLNLSGGGAVSPRPRFSAYGVSKAGVVRLTETLAEELRGTGVRINALAPGAINTSMLGDVVAAGDRAGETAAEQARAQLASGGGSMDRAVELAIFLASDDSAPLTGKLLSAPHDPWDTWSLEERTRLAETDWFTMRRLDPHTLATLPQL